MKKHLFMDISVIQTVPPSCVNRDDTGAPKTAVYGGTTRARVSSQSWKHAMRQLFKELFADELLGDRTKRVAEQVAAQIGALDSSLEAEKRLKLAIKALEFAGLSMSAKKEGQVDALLFLSYAQANALATLAVEGSTDKAQYKQALAGSPSVDMALFGRMVASDPSLNYDAAAQVAHSISTHTVQNEFDYFTAVDDRSPEDNAGAAHLGTNEYNSSTLYRYATVNLCELSKHLGTLTPMVVKGFVEAFVRAMPTGKQNSFANRTFPDCVYVTLRTDQPVNLCGAFEKPVYARDGGYAEKSVQELVKYATAVYDQYATKPLCAWGIGEGLADIAELLPLPALLDAVEQQAAEQLTDGEVQ